jgi:signal transduction histidine kinase
VTGLLVNDPSARTGAPSLRRFTAPALSPGLAAALWSALVALMLVVIAGLVLGDEDVPGYGIVFRLVGGAFVACGLIAWRRRPDSYSGLLMTATGFLLFVEPVFAQFDSGSAEVVGYVFGDLWSIPIVWLLLTMLSGGRLATRADRVLVAVFVVEFFLSLGSVLFLEYDGNFLLVRADEGLADGFETARALIVSVALIAIAVVIGARWRAASRPRRRAMWPGVAGIAALLSFAVAQQAAPIWLRWFAILSLLLIPAGFLAGLLSSRLARGGLADLFRRLPTMRGEELQPALARALGDPTVEVVRGRPHVPEGRSLAPVNDDAALVYDASLDDDPELIEAVASAAAIALESKARLERIVTAGDEERRRLERNLHDGAQQRLVALAMQLRLIQHELHSDDPAAAKQLVSNASEELAMSLAELRELARGIHPAVLNHGLEPALQSLAGQATVPTEVAFAAEGKLPEPVELAAYFVTSEALANVGKYARARTAHVRVAREGGGLVVEIADDGVGGADSTRGSGLRGLADRVEALDGRLQVQSPPGAGTVVRAEMPCAS